MRGTPRDDGAYRLHHTTVDGVGGSATIGREGHRAGRPGSCRCLAVAPYPLAMTYQPMPPPPAPRRTGRIVLTVVAVVLVLCCLGGSIGGFFLYRTVKDAVAPVSDSATSYLDAVRRGDHSAAYEQLCTTAKNRISESDFARQQSLLPRLTDYDITGVNVANNNGDTRGTVTARLTREGAEPVTQVFTLVKEDGTWRVCE